MEFGRLFDIFGAVIGVAMAFVLVSHVQTANIITAWGNAFSGSLRAATGR